ncbi:MAG TPA: RsiV family protein, partial [Acidimicrobiales bacterium]|nr:RsiV family protein [Acidimicrobiales bacterium]
ASVLEEESSGTGSSTLRGAGKVVYVDGRLLSVVYDFTTEWDGAATVQQETSTLLLDLSTGSEIAVADLFVAGSAWLDGLATAARADLAAQFGADTLFAEGLAAEASNFLHMAVVATGVVLRFDQYQVAPGVVGTPWVDLPWSAVAGLVDPAGPIAHLVP